MKKIIITVSIILCFVVGALLYIQHKHTSNLLVVEKNNSTSKNKKQEKKKESIYIYTIYDVCSPLNDRFNTNQKFIIRNKEELKKLENLTDSRLSDNLMYLSKYHSDDFIYFIEFHTSYYPPSSDSGVTFVLNDDKAHFEIKERQPKPDEPLLGLAMYYCTLAAVPSSQIENIDNFIAYDYLDKNNWYTLDIIH
jgi:hypothetical protein